MFIFCRLVTKSQQNYNIELGVYDWDKASKDGTFNSVRDLNLVWKDLIGTANFDVGQLFKDYKPRDLWVELSSTTKVPPLSKVKKNNVV
jgi:hypothetical protein